MLWHVTLNNYFYHWEMIWKYIFRNTFWSLGFFTLPKTWIMHTGQTYINAKNKYLQEQSSALWKQIVSVSFTTGCWGYDVWIFVAAAGNWHLNCFSLPEFFQESAGNVMSETRLQFLYLSPIVTSYKLIYLEISCGVLFKRIFTSNKPSVYANNSLFSLFHSFG